MMLHTEVQARLNAMRDLEQFLAMQGESEWAVEIGRAADLVEKSDAYGLKRFLGMFGGMGTLNDLVLYRNGTVLVTENEALDQFRSRASNLAWALRQEAP